MNDLSIEELLQKNPDVKEIFEENAKKLEGHRIVNRKGRNYGLALPYAGKQLLQEGQTDKKPPIVTKSYQRF